jgi:hypothetical protein
VERGVQLTTHRRLSVYVGAWLAGTNLYLHPLGFDDGATVARIAPPALRDGDRES